MSMLTTLAAATAAAACGPPPPPTAGPITTTLATTADTATTSTPDPAQPVTVVLHAPAVAPADHQPVPIEIRVHNGSVHPVTVGLAGELPYDVVVARDSGPAATSAVWSPMRAGTNSADATVTDPVPPGRDTTFQVLWPQTDDNGYHVPAGRYRARATVSAQLLKAGKLWTAWVPITVR